jgi:GNAT superfamily N-acetyltransferase
MQVRRAGITDLSQLSKLFDAYRVFYKKEPNLKGAESFLQERIEHNESVIFIALENDLMLGFVQLYPIFSSTRMKRMWLLNDLFVDELARGKGVSVLLIDACKQYCIETDACGLLLETAKTNTIGNQLYPRAGFQLDEDHNYYSWDV